MTSHRPDQQADPASRAGAGRTVVYTLHFWPPLGHAKHYTGSTPERRLAVRLTDHALGRGARLTQVQAERGGFWVLAQTQPGDRGEERRLKQHGATRRCEVCKAVEGYRAGTLSADDALARAGWDRSNPVQRSMLLDIFGLPKPREPSPDPASAPPKAPEAQPAATPVPSAPVPAPRSTPSVWPGQPVPTDPALDTVVDALIEGWRSHNTPTRPLPQPEPQVPAQPEPEAAL